MAAKTASLSVNIIADAAKARAGLKEAETAFGKFRREVGQAEGAMGKFRTISGSAFDYVKANAVTFATTAAAAIGAFAVKSVMAFQDLALSAGKFADATGLSTEEASRFIEVAGDIGVEATTVEKAIGFMNKTLGNTPELFKSMGIEIAYAADGSRDINGTFLNVIDRLNNIKDPADRAALATKLLGRNWMEMAELIGMGSDELQASLAAVSDSKIIDPGEVARAREFRAALDELKDRFEDISLELGEKLIPAITQSIDQFLVLADAVGKIPVLPDIFGNMLKGRPFHMALTESVIDLGREIVGLNTEVDLSTTSFEGLRVGLGNTSDEMSDAKIMTGDLSRWLGNQRADVDALKRQWDVFRGSLNYQAEFMRVEQQVEAFGKKWAGVSDEAKRDSDEYRQELNRAQTAVANLFLETAGLATWTQSNRIRLLIETGQLEYALGLINAIKQQSQNVGGPFAFPGPENIPIPQTPAPRPSTPPKNAAPPPAKTTPPKTPPKQQGVQNKLKNVKALAGGGTLTAGGMALVGENGPELVTLPRAASVIPSIPTRRMLGTGQMNVYITVQAGLVSSPDQVGAQIIDAIRRAERRSGQVFASI